MSEQKKYTVREILDESEYCDSVARESEEISKIGRDDEEHYEECLFRRISNMLRQVADAEEENAQLKARLAAVVKIAENNKWPKRGNVQADEDKEFHNYCMGDILRAARSESENENK